MWENRHYYNGLACLPFDGGTYKDIPFDTIEEKEYLERLALIEANPIDLTKIIEEEDKTDLSNELACSGGSCELI